MTNKESFHLLKYAPLWVYFFFYVVTCVVAAIPIKLGNEPFIFLLDYFSGVAPPVAKSLGQEFTYYALLILAPLVFGGGFNWLVKCGPLESKDVRNPPPGGKELELAIPWLVFILAAGIGLLDLIRAGAFEIGDAWVNYSSLIKSRLNVFSQLGYFSFINVYLIVPISAAWVLLAMRPLKGGSAAIKWLPPLVVFVLSIFVYQKKVMVVALIIIFGTLMLDSVLRRRDVRETRKWLLTVMIGAGLAYFLFAMLPVFQDVSWKTENITRETGAKLNPKQVKIIGLLGEDRASQVLAYAALAPLTRTSVPAMYYPVIYPALHPYYGLDFGLDILGYGQMPSDNHDVWDFMYPYQKGGGAAAAPFQFVLYSQVGLFWTLTICCAVGASLGFVWRRVMYCPRNCSRVSIKGVLVLLFCVFISMDSIRGSLVSSYGVLWGWLFISAGLWIQNRLIEIRNYGCSRRGARR